MTPSRAVALVSAPQTASMPWPQALSRGSGVIKTQWPAASSAAMSAVASHRPASSPYSHSAYFPYMGGTCLILIYIYLILLASPTGFEPVLPP